MLVLGFVDILFAQPDTLWTKTYGGTGDDYGYAIDFTDEGGFIIAGDYNAVYGYNEGKIYLLKTDSIGDTVWTNLYGGNNGDYGLDILSIQDVGYTICGYTQSFGSHNRDAYLMQVNTDGVQMWMNTYGYLNWNAVHSLHRTSDGGYILAGECSVAGSDNDMLFVRTDSVGGQVWLDTFGGQNFQGADAAFEMSDGGYLVSGTKNISGGGGFDPCIVRLDANADTLWTKTYGGPAEDFTASAIQTADNGMLITGITASFGSGEDDIYLLRVDEYGDTLWTRAYGGENSEWGLGIAELSDGGFIVTGQTNSFGNGSNDIYLLRIDADGDSLWFETYGGEGDDWGRDVLVTPDGGYIVAGYTDSYGAGGYDVYLFQTAGDPVSAKKKLSELTRNEFSIPSVYPNPFNPSTTISFELREEGFVSLSVFNIKGQSVGAQNFVPINQYMPVGSHQVVFDAEDLTSGVYFARLDAGDFRQTMKILLIK